MRTYSITVKDDETGKEVNYEFNNLKGYNDRIEEILDHYAALIYNLNAYMVVQRRVDLFGGADGVPD
jgi:hypothetical protein